MGGEASRHQGMEAARKVTPEALVWPSLEDSLRPWHPAEAEGRRKKSRSSRSGSPLPGPLPRGAGEGGGTSAFGPVEEAGADGEADYADRDEDGAGEEHL